MESDSRKIGLWQAVAIAVGTMIGASIFTIFGIGAKIAGDNLPEAFVLFGAFALFLTDSYARLNGKNIPLALCFLTSGGPREVHSTAH